MTPTLSARLSKIADEIEADPSRWTQGPIAVDKTGEAVSCRSPKACAWCAWGFTLREDFTISEMDVLDRAAGALLGSPELNCVNYNEREGRTAQDVVHLFRTAATLADKENA